MLIGMIEGHVFFSKRIETNYGTAEKGSNVLKRVSKNFIFVCKDRMLQWKVGYLGVPWNMLDPNGSQKNQPILNFSEPWLKILQDNIKTFIIRFLVG